MRGRYFSGLLPLAGTVLITGFPVPVLGRFTQSDAAAGIRTALERGVEVATSSPGRSDGFLGNPEEGELR